MSDLPPGSLLKIEDPHEDLRSMILTIAEAVLMIRRVTCEPGGHAKRWSEQHPFTRLEEVVKRLRAKQDD